MTLFEFSSLLSTVYAEAPAEERPEKVADAEEVDEEEEEEDEPEDHMPAVVEACEQSAECAPAKHHLDECASRVAAGANENCVEEFFHLMHCVDHCAAPKIFEKLV